MKSNVKENIGYICIALVVALTLVLSVVAIDTYQNQDITAFAFAPSSNTLETFPDSISLLDTESYSDRVLYYGINHNFFFSFEDYKLYQVILYGTNNYDSVFFTITYYPPFNQFVIANDFGYNDYFIELEFITSDTTLISVNNPSDFNSIYVYDIREVVSSSNDVQSSFLGLIGDGITFGFESIADGVSYTMDNLFIVDGELTNFSIVIFLTLGIGLALAIVKFVLRFIFSLGGNRKW